MLSQLLQWHKKYLFMCKDLNNNLRAAEICFRELRGPWQDKIDTPSPQERKLHSPGDLLRCLPVDITLLCSRVFTRVASKCGNARKT